MSSLDPYGESRGFTLLELMVVVMIAGILASVAVPTFSRYMKRSKTTEVLVNLRKIYDGEVAYFQEEHVNKSGGTLSPQFVPTRCEPVGPPKKDKVRGHFDHVSWEAIKFSPDGFVYYSYLVEVVPDHGIQYPRPSWVPGYTDPPPQGIVAAFLARGFGDLDEDGQVSEFARMAAVYSAKGEIEGFPGIFQLDPLE